MGIAEALIIGAVATAAAGASAYGEKEAAEDAQHANKKNADRTDRLNLNAYNRARGSTGYAFMPLYAKGPNGQPLEVELFQRARSYYESASNQSPEEFMAGLAEIQQGLSNLDSQARRVGGDLFSGKMTDDILKEFRSLEEARLKTAESTKAAEKIAVSEELNRIRAGLNSKGFTGDSFGGNLLKARTSMDISGNYARDRGNVNVQNEADKFQIRQAGRQLQLNNMNLPAQLGLQSSGIQSFTQAAAGARSAYESGMFDQFRLPYQPFSYGGRPQVAPTPNGWTIGGDVLGAAANSGLGIWGAVNEQDLLKQLIASRTT